MGYGSYSYEAHRAMTAARHHASVEDVFTQRSCHPLMDPKGVKVRESRDSAEHPSSLGVIFALDVSGSMGDIPRLLAQQELPGFMKAITDCGVQSPQVLFMAFQDIDCSPSPLQVGQFESTAELMDQWLTWCWLEGGGTTAYESYDLAFYFAARHTAMDCWEKRRHKGYLFMTGDEPSYPALDRAAVKRFLGDDLDRDLPLAEMIAEVRQSFHPFFLIPDRQRAQRVEPAWREVLGPNVIAMDGPELTCAVAAGLLALSERAVSDLDALRASFRGQDMRPEIAAGAIAAIEPWAKATR